MLRMLTTIFALMLATGIAIAGTPFGGDDTGFVPPDKAAYKCASKVQAALAKLQLSITMCHQRMANEGLRGDAGDDEPCENAAKAKFDATVSKLLSSTTCPPCLVSATAGLSDTVEAQLDGATGDYYCLGIKLFGGDHTGWEPINGLQFECQSGIARAVAKLAQCVNKCHQHMALYLLNGRPFDEEACEATCLGKYNRIRDIQYPHCPGCLQMPQLDQLAADAMDAQDQGLGTYYCASPSGAFVDPTR